MEPRAYKRQRLTIPSSGAPYKEPWKQGFTLIELLVSIALLAILMTIVFNTFLSSNNLVETDIGRINATQNTQGAMDLLVADVRQAGENLDLSLGISGLEFDSSSLTVRRSIPPLTLLQSPSGEPGLAGQTVKSMSICSLDATNRIQIIGPPPKSDSPAPSATSTCTYSTRLSDKEDANVKIWRVYFASQSGRPQVAILARPADTATGQIAMVRRVIALSVDPTQLQIYSGNTEIRRVSITLRDPVPAGFTAANGSTLTLVDERRYIRDSTSNELRLALGGQTDMEASVVAFNISGFTTTAVLRASGTSPESTVPSMSLQGPWERVKRVNLSLTGGNAGVGRNRNRTFTTSVFPRNVESTR